MYLFIFFFFFQAEDGIRDVAVTGVQTCALPIYFAVFYLRCDFLQTPILERPPFFAGPVAPSEQTTERLEDGIGKALRGLKPRILAVDSAQGLRRALAAILSDISRM